MTEKSYQRCMAWTEKYIGVNRVRVLVKLLTVITVLGYGVTIVGLLIQRDFWVLRVILVPAAGFVAVSLLRRCLGAKRPYEKYAFTPLLKKDTKGNSFPSRHVFSNIIIAMAVLSVWVPGGILLMVCGAFLAVLRVITGVHFPRDVIAGGVIAVVMGVLGFFLW